MISFRLNRNIFVKWHETNISHKCVKQKQTKKLNWILNVNKTCCGHSLSLSFCNVSENVESIFIVNSVIFRLLDKHVYDLYS